MQTAMQEHIEVMKNELLNMYQNDIRFGMLLKLIRKADDLLKKERQQILTSFNDGESNVWDRHKNENDFEFENAYDYYEKTFKGEAEVS